VFSKYFLNSEYNGLINSFKHFYSFIGITSRAFVIIAAEMIAIIMVLKHDLDLYFNTGVKYIMISHTKVT
jgi:hypothetical protein